MRNQGLSGERIVLLALIYLTILEMVPLWHIQVWVIIVCVSVSVIYATKILLINLGFSLLDLPTKLKCLYTYDSAHLRYLQDKFPRRGVAASNSTFYYYSFLKKF